MAWVRKYWLLLAAAALAIWWFFSGDTPMSLIRAFVGRGQKLTVTTNAGGDVTESLDDLVAQVVGTLGREVDPDAVIMARVAASENGKGTAREKQAIQCVLLNDAANHFNGDVYKCATNGRAGMGAQSGPGFVRRYSTVGGGLLGYREIHEDDLSIAERLRAGELTDETGGAEKFIHYTGYAHLEDFLAAHPKVQGWIDSGLIPVSLSGTGVLVCFTRTPEAANVG